MQLLRHHLSAQDLEGETHTLARAEYLCDQAEALHQEAVARADQIIAEAKSEAARLLRGAIALIDENAARSEAARSEADRVLAEAGSMQVRMASAYTEPAVAPTVVKDELLDLRAFAS